MDTPQEHAYVPVKPSEIEDRLDLISDNELTELSLEQPEHQAARFGDPFNPYCRN